MEYLKNITFSVDLVESAKSQLDFLKDVDHEGFFYSGEILQHALYRYERYWLPLCVDFESSGEKSTNYYPHLDVAWVWHCHIYISYRVYKRLSILMWSSNRSHLSY